jgi:hypothetical protein
MADGMQCVQQFGKTKKGWRGVVQQNIRCSFMHTHTSHALAQPLRGCATRHKEGGAFPIMQGCLLASPPPVLPLAGPRRLPHLYGRRLHGQPLVLRFVLRVILWLRLLQRQAHKAAAPCPLAPAALPLRPAPKQRL